MQRQRDDFIAAGDLRHRIKINRMVDAQGAEFGQAKLTAVLFADRVPALVEPLTGTELTNADKQETGLTHKITMRWMSGIEPKMQIVFEERTFNVVSAINVRESRRKLILRCMEKT